MVSSNGAKKPEKNILLKKNESNCITLSSPCLKTSAFERRLYSFGTGKEVCAESGRGTRSERLQIKLRVVGDAIGSFVGRRERAD